ncbi:hypothetical protein LTR95_003777 [Oleoguttula sp. CCFEE 5521]
MDLASIDSDKAAPGDFSRREARLDLLMANAGIIALPPGLTTDGYELQFGTNHMGHAALINLLLLTLTITAEQCHDTRIVTISSDLFNFMSFTVPLSKMDTSQSAHGPLAPQRRYGESKLANQLYARELVRRYPTITTVAIHPGVGNTGLQDDFTGPTEMMVRAAAMVMPMMTAEQTAWNQTWAATAPLGNGETQMKSGVYYERGAGGSMLVTKVLRSLKSTLQLQRLGVKELRKVEIVQWRSEERSLWLRGRKSVVRVEAAEAVW